RTDEQAFERPLDPQFETAFLATRGIKRREPFDIQICYRPPVCPPLESRDDPLRTGQFLGGSRRSTHKNTTAAGRVPGPFGAIRAAAGGRISSFGNERHPFAIHTDLELLRLSRCATEARGGRKLHLDCILAVQREITPDCQASSCTESQSIHASILWLFVRHL